MENKYFYDSGEYKEGSIPNEAFGDCHHSGQCDIDVMYWVEKLDFDFPKDQGIEWLKGFGAWDDEELDNHEENRLRVLWLFAGNVADGEEIYGLVN